MPWQITRYSCPGTVKIKLCPVSARFFSLFFPSPPPFTLPLSFSLLVSFFILLSAGKCASEEEVAARQELLPRLLLSPCYWDWVNGADGWRRAIKMEGFVPPPLPSAWWQRQPSLLTHMQAPTLPPQHCWTPTTLHPCPLHPRRSALLIPQLCNSCTSQPLYTSKYCYRLWLLKMLFSHRSGPHALVHTWVRKHTHAQIQLPALKSIAIQVAAPTLLFF